MVRWQCDSSSLLTLNDAQHHRVRLISGISSGVLDGWWAFCRWTVLGTLSYISKKQLNSLLAIIELLNERHNEYHTFLTRLYVYVWMYVSGIWMKVGNVCLRYRRWQKSDGPHCNSIVTFVCAILYLPRHKRKVPGFMQCKAPRHAQQLGCGNTRENGRHDSPGSRSSSANSGQHANMMHQHDVTVCSSTSLYEDPNLHISRISTLMSNQQLYNQHSEVSFVHSSFEFLGHSYSNFRLKKIDWYM